MIESSPVSWYLVVQSLSLLKQVLQALMHMLKNEHSCRRWKPRRGK